MRAKWLWPLTAAMLLFWAIPINAQAGTLEQGLAAYEAKKYEDAYRLLSPLAEKGNVEAAYRVGRMYEKGNGVSKDLTLAAKWYRQAASRGHAEAQYRVAVGYTYGLGGLNKDDAEAGRWLKKSAEGGYKKAQKMLAEAYARGELGFSRDEKLAQHWRNKAGK